MASRTKDLSINFVPVPYPRYPPAVVKIRPAEKQLWCVLNASAITYLDVQMLVGTGANGGRGLARRNSDQQERNVREIASCGRAMFCCRPRDELEFIVKGPAEGCARELRHATVDTGPPEKMIPRGRSRRSSPIRTRPNRACDWRLLRIPLPAPRSIWLGNVKPVRTRTLYFSENRTIRRTRTARPIFTSPSTARSQKFSIQMT